MTHFHPFLILCLSCILMSCTISSETNIKNNGRLAIVSNDIGAIIHTKMIVGNYATVSLLDKDKKNDFSIEEKELINASDIIITIDGVDNNNLEKILQQYHGTHLRLPKKETSQKIAKISETIAQIEAIRDIVSELDNAHHGYFYDTAGNYENNIRETYRKLEARLNEYNKQSFLFFGEDMSLFLADFGLAKYNIGLYPSNYLQQDPKVKTKEIQKIVEDKKIKIAFIHKNTDKNIGSLLKKLGVTIYVLDDIEDDTSAWGYIRHIEKLVNIFVTAFNAYD